MGAELLERLWLTSVPLPQVSFTRLVGGLRHSAVQQSGRVCDDIFPLKRRARVLLFSLNMKMAEHASVLLECAVRQLFCDHITG